MDSFEFNKIFAAILVAGITVSSVGFISEKLVHPQEVAAHGEAATGEAAGAAAAPQVPEPVLALIAAADAAHGQKLSRACATCHSFDKGGAGGVGPNLWNVMTRGRATTDFAYSAGMKNKGGQWTYGDLNHFLWKPKKFLPDTKMVFAGLKKPEDRAAVIAWLRALSDSPPALPSDADIAAEKVELGVTEEHEGEENYNP